MAAEKTLAAVILQRKELKDSKTATEANDTVARYHRCLLGLTFTAGKANSAKRKAVESLKWLPTTSCARVKAD
eukprot:5557122-Amphidinium_carterae.1